MCGKYIAPGARSSFPFPLTGVSHRGAPVFTGRKRPDREVIEAMTHEEFAYRAERRLLEAADRLEGEARDLGIHGEASKTRARARELRVAALLVREEAEAVGREERSPTAEVAENPPLEAQT